MREDLEGRMWNIQVFRLVIKVSIIAVVLIGCSFPVIPLSKATRVPSTLIPTYPTTPAPTPTSIEFVEQASYTGDCKTRPSGSVCIKFNDGFIWLIYDSISGWKDGDWLGKPVQIAQGFYHCDYYHVLNTTLIKSVCK